ncbi:MAG TPA: hypothetical protein VM370_05720 [Candidatus Thermoplasmatota archaeon]|nr:hypothetical protein [Candidatus Thermoplasmatota archaeon]
MRLVATVLVVLLLPVAQAGYGDAGSGGDAPNAEALAYALPSEGTYYGGLASLDQDWFRTPVRTSSALCVDYDEVGGVPEQITVAVGSVRATMDRAARESASLGVAGYGDGARLGIANTGAQQGLYGFDVDVTRLSDLVGDAGTGGDVSGDVATPTAIGPGCTGGTVGGITPLDTKDAYTFDAEASDVALLTLASSSTAIRLDLLESDGSLLATIVPGQALRITMPETGSYYITASQIGFGSTDYLMGVGIGPPGQGCRPACLSS